MSSNNSTGAFYRTGIESVDFTDCVNIKYIGQQAFYQCDKLTTVLGLSEKNFLTEILTDAFYDCTSLLSIDLSNCSSLETIGAGAFMNCNSLELVNLSGCSALTSIDNGAFELCDKLSHLNLNGCISLETIGESAFETSGLISVDLTDLNLSSIGNLAFAYSSNIEEVFLPSSLIEMGVACFNSNKSMKPVVCLAETPPYII